tara:strand:+ start:496 stop:810 length:315 start_codon:yes stop_codon:yes gene_type:complete
MTTRRSVKLDETMFDRLIEEIRICDNPEDLDVVLSNEFNDTLYFEGGPTMTVSHWDTQTERRVHVDFLMKQLVTEQKEPLLSEMAALIIRGVDNIIEEANSDVE